MYNILQMQTPVTKDPDNFVPRLFESGEASYKIINANGTAPIILVCEHACNHIPKYFARLGLSPEVINSHIAWDPGAYALASGLSGLFNAPLVASNVSRLVYDCNRPADDASAMTARSEVFEVPGNVDIPDNEVRARIEQVYNPFSEALNEVVMEKMQQRPAPALVTIHSFTPIYFGTRRDVEIGILHSDDQRLADVMLELAPQICDLNIQRNQPYGPKDGVAHTLNEHGLKNKIPNVMIEVRNDLLADEIGVKQVRDTLFRLISEALPRLNPQKSGGE